MGLSPPVLRNTAYLGPYIDTLRLGARLPGPIHFAKKSASLTQDRSSRIRQEQSPQIQKIQITRMERMRRLFSCAICLPFSKSRREKRREDTIAEVRAECQAWLDAIPGPMNAASNVCASSHVKSFLRGDEITAAEISMLHSWMSYRLDLMSLATAFKGIVGLEYPDCIGFDCQAWGEQACSQRRELMNRYLDRVLDARIFPRPTSLQGRADQKPEHYLACAIVDAGWTKFQVEAALKLMAARSGRLVDYPWR